MYNDLRRGTLTPAFTGGTPTRSGYTFTGWSPAVAATVTANAVYIAQWRVIATYTVTYKDGVGGAAFEDQTITGLHSGDPTPAFSGTPTRSGYTFKGWLPDVSATVMETVTYVSQWEKRITGDGGGHTTKYTLHYESNGGTTYPDEYYTYGTVVTLDKVPTRAGYIFTGWYADKELTQKITSVKMTSDKTVYAGWEATGVPGMLNGDDHYAYVVG